MAAPFHCVVTCGIIQLRVGAKQIALVEVYLDRKGHIRNVKERSRAMRGGERERDLKCFTDLLHAAALVSHALCHGISSASLE